MTVFGRYTKYSQYCSAHLWASSAQYLCSALRRPSTTCLFWPAESEQEFFLLLHSNRLQFEVAPGQKRSRPYKFARRIIFR